MDLGQRLVGFGDIPNKELALFSTGPQQFTSFIESSTVDLVLVGVYPDAGRALLRVPDQH